MKKNETTAELVARLVANRQQTAASKKREAKGWSFNGMTTTEKANRAAARTERRGKNCSKKTQKWINKIADEAIEGGW